MFSSFYGYDNYYNIDVDKTIEFLKTIPLKRIIKHITKKQKKISAILITHVWGNAVDIIKLKESVIKEDYLFEDVAKV